MPDDDDGEGEGESNEDSEITKQDIREMVRHEVLTQSTKPNKITVQSHDLSVSISPDEATLEEVVEHVQETIEDRENRFVAYSYESRYS